LQIVETRRAQVRHQVTATLWMQASGQLERLLPQLTATSEM
jgi:hypothetical protein